MELVIDHVVDTSLADAHRRANEWMAHAKAKPNRNEDEGTFTERVANIMYSENNDRKTSQMKKNHRVGETTMTTEEVGAAAEARKRYSELKLKGQEEEAWEDLGRGGWQVSR